MEMLFDNKCAHTASSLTEMVKNKKAVSRKRTLVFVLSFFGALMIHFLLCALLAEHVPSAICIAPTTTALLLIVGLLSQYRHDNIAIILRQTEVIYHRELEVQTQFFPTYFISKNLLTGAVTHFDYRQIVRVTQTHSLFLLYLEEDIIHMLDKDRFEFGSPADFWEFIAQKTQV